MNAADDDIAPGQIAIVEWCARHHLPRWLGKFAFDSLLTLLFCLALLFWWPLEFVIERIHVHNVRQRRQQ